jgi:hypothetical protein
LLISENLDEIRTLSDRIAVMYEGQIIGILGHDQATVEQIDWLDDSRCFHAGRDAISCREWSWWLMLDA